MRCSVTLYRTPARTKVTTSANHKSIGLEVHTVKGWQGRKRLWVDCCFPDSDLQLGWLWKLHPCRRWGRLLSFLLAAAQQ